VAGPLIGAIIAVGCAAILRGRGGDPTARVAASGKLGSVLGDPRTWVVGDLGSESRTEAKEKSWADPSRRIWTIDRVRHRCGLIAVAVDGNPESRDAAVLAATIADVTKAEVMLIAVHPGAPVVLPSEMSWVAVHQRAADMVHELRDNVLPDAGMVIESDQSVGRALERIATLEHRDLLVVGSSSEAPVGRVRIGNRTREMLEQTQCAVAIAPRGLSARPPRKLGVIGVEYDGEPEAREALNLARSLARGSGARLRVEAPPVDLLARSEVVDLLVIGSRRSGPAEAAHARSTVGTLLDAPTALSLSYLSDVLASLASQTHRRGLTDNNDAVVSDCARCAW
jgi:nucleotide-binding universal stress UspA family protein